MAASPLIWVPLAEIFYLAAVWSGTSRLRSRSDRRIAQPILDQTATGLMHEVRGAPLLLRRPRLSQEREKLSVRAAASGALEVMRSSNNPMSHLSSTPGVLRANHLKF
jgi:hypothetical protein